MTTDPVRVRTARVRDATAIRVIDGLTQTPMVSPADPVDPADAGGDADETDPFARHGVDDTLVAVAGTQVAGYVVLARPTLLRANAHVWAIEGLAVHPDRQGRGIGRRLVDAALTEVVHRGGRRVTLRVLGTNPGARRLYQAAGFVVEGVLAGEFVIDGVDVDDVLMARGVGDSGASAGE